MMGRYLAEAYTPASPDVAEIETRARLAAAELSVAGTPVRYVRSIFMPDDETCFHLFEADSPEAVYEAARRAGFVSARITRAIEAGLDLVMHEDEEIL
jgi:hypothetical protein